MTVLDKAVKISIIVGALIATLSVIYYFIAIPILNEKKLNTCLQEGDNKIAKARESYSNGYTNESVADRIVDKINNPKKYLATEEIISRGEDYKQECFKRFPQ